ncbi:MAG: FKBP-type peptidyl-prolyl cis-trans isomerase [Gemmatimonadetes bacterium]|nr:FKBP-type peptidyl-prolyl cis-trans isomerase [Gemmatimonadota bacterium]
MTPSTPRLGVLLASFTFLACSGDATSDYESAAMETNDQKASYGIGLNMGGQLAAAKDRLDRMALLRGIEDGLQGRDPQISDGEMQQILMQFGNEVESSANAERAAQGEANRVAGEAYLAQNGAKTGVTTTESGLQYEVLRVGDGERPTRESTVRLHYRGTLVDGTEFDTSYGGEPAVFMVSGVIPGFTEALLLMQVGSHYRIVIPSLIAYGPQGTGRIGPNSTLIFEIELLEIVDAE